MHRSHVPNWLRVCIVFLFAFSFVTASMIGCETKKPVTEAVPDSGNPDEGGTKTCAASSECPTGQGCFGGKCSVPECTTDAECKNGGKCEQSTGKCSGGGCTADTDCPPGQTCKDSKCEQGQVGGDPTKIEIVEAGGVLREGQTKQFTARALNASGATLTGDFKFEWTSSASDSVSIDGTTGLATGGTKDGEASITVKLKELTSEAVKVLNYAAVADGKARLIVVDEQQKGISGAKVKIGDKEGDTDANGVVVIDGATAPFEVHVFHNDYTYFSAYGVDKTDLYVQLNKNADTSKAGGVKGKFNFDKVQALFGISDEDWGEYAVGFGVAGVSLSENLLSLDFNLLVGESFKVNLFGQNLSLPSGLVVALASGGKPDFQSLGEPGRKLLWGFGGKFKLDQVTPIIAGATGGTVNIGAILASAKPLFKSFAFGFIPDVQIALYPRVADTEDKNGDGKTDDMIPDFGKFPEVSLELNQKLDKPIPVTIGAFPKVTHNGKPVELLSLAIAGVLVPGIGLVPMGLDVDEAKGDSGTLEVKYTERQGILKTGNFAVVTLALNIPTGDDAPPLTLFGDIKQEANPPSSVTVSSFLPLGTPKYDKAGRKLEGAVSDGATLFQVESTDDKGRKWLVVFDASANGTVTLPTPPNGFDDRAASAKTVSYRPIKLSGGQTMNSVLEFNSINMDKLATVITGFASATVFEEK